MKVQELFGVSGKIALVTGGSRGIGLMIARGFVENGAKTYIAARKREECETAAAELSKLGACIPLVADLATLDGVRALAKTIAEREDKLHVLVNNAGANWAEPIEVYPEAGWDKVVSLNLKAPFFLTRELLPRLKAAATADDPARVINVASIDGLHVPGLDTFAYSSSKAGLVHQSRVLAKKLAPDNITVNAIAPGPFESKMMAETLRRFGDIIRSTNPRGRIGTPEDMAGVAIYLASRAGAYVTGVVIPVDGGISTTL